MEEPKEPLLPGLCAREEGGGGGGERENDVSAVMNMGANSEFIF